MREVEARFLGDRVRDLYIEVSRLAGPDVIEALERSMERERSPRGRDILRILLDNAMISRERELPLCQDTGAADVFIYRGTEVVIRGGLDKEISRGIREATRSAGLRSSIRGDPLVTGSNTGDNTPPITYCRSLPGDRLKIGVMAAGGGCGNASATAMLPPSVGWEGVVEFVVDLIRVKGAGACPPLFLGVTVGGSFDRAPEVSKEALFDDFRMVERADGRERELLEAVNATGIGPGGLGGTVTCMGVHLRTLPCHIASLPVAVAVSCHALRRKVVEL